MVSTYVDTTGGRCLRWILIPILEVPKLKMSDGPSYPTPKVNGDPRVLLFPAQSRQGLPGGNEAEPRKLFSIWRELSLRAQEDALAEILEIASAAKPTKPPACRSDPES